MARLMVFNALAHNHDDHSKNFAFLCVRGLWRLAPAYDLTFSQVQGMADEHTTSFAGSGLPSRKALRKVCEPFSFLKVDQYIEQAFEALSGWDRLCVDMNVERQQASMVSRAFAAINKRL